MTRVSPTKRSLLDVLARAEKAWPHRDPLVRRFHQAFRSTLLLLVVSLSTPAPASAETIVYFLGHSVVVPAWIMLLVFGLALLAVAIGLKKLRRVVRDRRNI